MEEMQIRPLGWEDSMEKEMATHSSILPWKISWTDKPGKYNPWDRKRAAHNLATKQQ